MNDGAGAILRQLAKTAVLVLALGAALYGAISVVAELSHGRWLIALILAGPLTALLAFVVLDALRNGAIPVWRSAVTRDRQPLTYWFNVGWFAACAVALAAIAVWSGAELMAALLDQR